MMIMDSPNSSKGSPQLGILLADQTSGAFSVSPMHGERLSKLSSVQELVSVRDAGLTETKVKQRPIPRCTGCPLPGRSFSDVAHPDVGGAEWSPRHAFTGLQSTPNHGSSIRCCNKLKKN